MRIDHLSIKNFKNFADLSVDFEPGVNLFVGTNGSGKTSILEAINIAVAGFFYPLKNNKYQRAISFDEIRIVDRVRAAEATVAARSADIPGSGWSRTIRSETKVNDSKGIAPIASVGKDYFDRYFHDSSDRHLAPLIGYYSTQRLFRDSNISGKQNYDAAAGRMNGYLLCLKETSIKGVLEEWLFNAIVRRASKFANGIDETDIILENVESAVKNVLNYALGVPDDQQLRIYPDPDFENQLFIRYDNEHNLPLEYYSDGFRNMIYLIIDLVWRASQLNPWLRLAEFAQITGVVTIDEIDLHLHPRWQAKAIAVLQRLFPNVQFFITTHSPTVVANFEHGTLYIISSNSIERSNTEYFGRQINNVLRNILGAADRHKPTQEKLNHLFNLILEKKTDDYKPLYKELLNLLGHDDIDIQKATALIDMQQLLAE